MSQNTRSQSSKASGASAGDQPLSETEMDVLRQQLAEKEKRLKEQSDTILLQQGEFEKQQKEFEEARSSNTSTSDLSLILSSIQRDLSSLKALNEKVQNLEKRVTDVSDDVHVLPSQRLPPDTVSEEPVTPNASLGMPRSRTPPSPLPGGHCSNSTIREALELVPKYDGHSMPVLQFVRACKRAKELIPLTFESHLVRLLRNKLVGHAYLAVEDETHETINQLIDCLKRTFGPARDSNYYRGQLSMNYKKPSDHILDYIGRVKDLRTAIIEGDQTQFGRTLNNCEIEQIDSYVLESFFEGLPPEYRTEIRLEGYVTLSEAYNKAVLINKRLERDRTRLRDTKPHSTTTPSPSTAENTTPKISILQPDRRQPSTTSSPTEAKICTYCKNFGHLISECKKRQYNNTKRENIQGNLPGPSTSGANQGQAAVRPLFPIAGSPPSNSAPEPCPQSS